MARLLATVLISALIGFAGGAAAWYAFGPLFVDRVVDEILPPDLALAERARGAFRDADAQHRGRGEVRLMESPAGTRLLRLTGFAVTNGPDLELWLVEAGGIRSTADVAASGHVSLGTLKGNRGDQTYVLPPDLDPARFRSVVVWCRAFGILFSPAELVRS